MGLSTAEKIRNLLTDIVRLGAKIKSKEICGKADKCMALLDNLEIEMQLESKKSTPSQ